eukprot:scaffold14095_cov33-Prasinocladus_malaysianus.AAC.1
MYKDITQQPECRPSMVNRSLLSCPSSGVVPPAGAVQAAAAHPETLRGPLPLPTQDTGGPGDRHEALLSCHIPPQGALASLTDLVLLHNMNTRMGGN